MPRSRRVSRDADGFFPRAAKMPGRQPAPASCQHFCFFVMWRDLLYFRAALFALVNLPPNTRYVGNPTS